MLLLLFNSWIFLVSNDLVKKEVLHVQKKYLSKGHKLCSSRRYQVNCFHRLHTGHNLCLRRAVRQQFYQTSTMATEHPVFPLMFIPELGAALFIKTKNICCRHAHTWQPQTCCLSDQRRFQCQGSFLNTWATCSAQRPSCREWEIPPEWSKRSRRSISMYPYLPDVITQSTSRVLCRSL